MTPETHIELTIKPDQVRIGVYLTHRRMCRCLQFEIGKTLDEVLGRLRDDLRDQVKRMLTYAKTNTEDRETTNGNERGGEESISTHQTIRLDSNLESREGLPVEMGGQQAREDPERGS